MIQSVNFDLSGFALGSTKDDITVTPDESTMSILVNDRSYDFDIFTNNPVRRNLETGELELKGGLSLEDGKIKAGKS